MTSTREPRTWPILDRPHELDHLVAAITAEPTHGVVVTGETGIGKTTLALSAARRAAGGEVHLHGSEAGRTVPYAALQPLLEGAPTSTEPTVILRQLADALARRSPDAPAVVVVDPAPHLDDHSCHALSHLAKARLIRLVVLARRLPQVPMPLLEMWRDGMLAHHDVRPWTTEEVGEQLVRYLGGPVVAWTTRELARVSGHQPLFLRFAVDEQLRSATLVQQDGIWLLSGTPTFGSAELADVLRARLDRRTPQERDVVELVALAEALPYDVLEQLTDHQTLHALLDAGVLAVDAEPRARVVVSHPTVAALTRSSVPFQRRRQLRDRLLERWDGPEDGSGRLAFLSWTLDAGVPLDGVEAVRAAAEANALHAPELALRLLGAIRSPRSAAAVAQESVARRLLGELETAGALVAEFADSHDDLSADDLAELATELAVVAALMPEAAGAAHRLLDRAESRQHEPHRLLRAARFDLLASEGRYVEMLADLEKAVADSDRSDAWAMAAGCLLEALSLTGRQQDALLLVEELGAVLPGMRLSPVAFDVAYAAIFGVMLKSGLLQQARDLLAANAEPMDVRMLVLGAATDSAIGMTMVLGGHADDARPLLAQALVQSRVRDPRRTRGQIAAGLAYAAVLQGDEATARTCLVEWAAAPRTYWNVSASADLLAYSARLLLDGVHATEADLRRVAEEHATKGMVVDQLLLLTVAARAGSTEALHDVLALDVAQPGPLVASIQQWARGRRDGDADALLGAAQQLLALGNPLFAREAAEAAIRLGGPTLARARTLAQQAAAVLTGGPVDSGGSVLDGLTPREREVSERAARGESNKEIAAALVLSVRTVESYLQSAFGKLGVRSRAELAELLAP